MKVSSTIVQLLIALACSSLLTAQTGSPVATPGAASPAATIKTGTRLVLIDVVVLDRAHKPITSLNAGDFSIAEDGVAKKIKSFEFHAGGSAATPAQSEAPQKQEPGVFTNATTVQPSDSLNVILLDELNTQLTDQGYVRSQVRDFLKRRIGQERIAIFALRNSRLMMLQGFTSDAASLKAAVNGSDAAAASGLLTDPSGMGGDSPLVHQSREGKALQLELRDRYTLQAINELARYLGQFPGRKNLIWFAGSFPLSIVPDVSLGRSRGTDLGAEDRLRETNNLLEESRIAVYPADSHGQPAPFGTDASVSGPEYVKKPGLFAADTSVSLQNEDIDHGTMERLAHDTGGAAFYNTNGLGQTIANAIAEGSSYYTLSYQPDGDTKANAPAEYRRIEVKIAGAPYVLSYRRGYFAGSFAASSGQSGTAVSQTSFEAAMHRGAPDAMQIVFKARVLPVASRPEQSATASNKPDPKVKGPWQNYKVDIAADPRPLHWNKIGDDAFEAKLEFAAVVFDQEGRPVNSLSDAVAANLSKAKLLEATRTGVALFTRVSVPVHGTYWLRIGIRDLGTGHMGTVEVPISVVKDLPALVSEP